MKRVLRPHGPGRTLVLSGLDETGISTQAAIIAGPLDGMDVREENLRSLNPHATILALLGVEGETLASKSIITED